MPKADSVVFDITDLIKGEKSNFLFMRTDTYTLDTNQYLTVLPGHTAEIYVKYAAMHSQGPCTKKKLHRLLEKDHMGRDFHIVFLSGNKLPKNTWGVGKLPVRCGNYEYQVGSNGTFEAVIEDHNAYIESVIERGSILFDVDRVNEHLISAIRNAASEILVDLFEEVGTMIISADFLLDELNLRFKEYFIDKNLLKIPGLRIISIEVSSLLIREEDIQNVRDALSAPPQRPAVKRRSPRSGTTKKSPRVHQNDPPTE
ncbi:MAG: hypothetical protein IJY04_00810 [Clostridia bacterium]|nr:hypothetical protein [Clostridia bacterium]